LILIKIFIYTKSEDDPSACTAEKLIKHGLAKRISSYNDIPPCSIVLNPMASTYLKQFDRIHIENCGIVALDVSWKRGAATLKKIKRGYQRVLPILIAANNVNYGKPFKLSTAEALIAALMITGFHDYAFKIASLFKWGSTFIQLNSKRFELYSQVKTDEDIEQIQCKLFGLNCSKNGKLLNILHRIIENDEQY